MPEVSRQHFPHLDATGPAIIVKCSCGYMCEYFFTKNSQGEATAMGYARAHQMSGSFDPKPVMNRMVAEPVYAHEVVNHATL